MSQLSPKLWEVQSHNCSPNSERFPSFTVQKRRSWALVLIGEQTNWMWEWLLFTFILNRHGEPWQHLSAWIKKWNWDVYNQVELGSTYLLYKSTTDDLRCTSYLAVLGHLLFGMQWQHCSSCIWSSIIYQCVVNMQIDNMQYWGSVIIFLFQLENNFISPYLSYYAISEAYFNQLLLLVTFIFWWSSCIVLIEFRNVNCRNFWQFCLK